MDKKQKDRISVVIDAELKKRLQELADLDGRSLNNYIVRVLENHIDNSDHKPKGTL